MPTPIARERHGVAIMQSEKLYLTSLDNHKIFVRKWSPDAAATSPRAIIHILHGMAEHCTRYEPIAERMVDAGYVVFAHDHRGHGRSIPQGGLVGHYADHNGWPLVIADTRKVNEHIHQQYPGIPVIIVGHSMGSFITQGYLIQHGRTVDAVVLSGSAFNTPMAIRSARMLAHLEKLRTGPKGRSSLIDMATFASYNRQVAKSPRTGSDWLSRDPCEVDKYVGDPLCGFLCTNQLWLDLTGGLEQISRLRNIRNIPPALPILLISGERDPLSFDNSRHGIEKLAEHLRSGGVREVSVRLYEDARHEIFNEINRHEVIDDVLAWLDTRFSTRENVRRTDAAMA